jgi:hypothetical protein
MFPCIWQYIIRPAGSILKEIIQQDVVIVAAIKQENQPYSHSWFHKDCFKRRA